MLLQDAAHDILVDLDTEGIRDLLRDFETPEPRIAAFHLDHGGNELCGGSLGPRFCTALGGIAFGYAVPGIRRRRRRWKPGRNYLACSGVAHALLAGTTAREAQNA